MQDAVPQGQVGQVSFAGAIDKAQYCRVVRAIQPVWIRWYALLAYCVLGFIGLGTGWGQALDKPVSTLIDAVEGAVVFAIATALARWQTGRNWRTYTRLHNRVSGSVSETGLALKSDTTAHALGWDKLLGYRIASDIALVYYAPRCAFFLPRSFFASDADWAALRGLLERYSKPI